MSLKISLLNIIIFVMVIRLNSEGGMRKSEGGSRKGEVGRGNAEVGRGKSEGGMMTHRAGRIG